MKIACIAVLLALAMSASAAPFSFAGVSASATEEDTNSASLTKRPCGAEQKALHKCCKSIGKVKTAGTCITKCLKETQSEATDLGAACNALSECNTKCTPGCINQLVALSNCQNPKLPCTVPSAIESSVMKLSDTFKQEKKNLRA